MPTFGVTVGEKFEWIDHENDGDAIIHEFRARAGIPFDDVLEWRRLQAKIRILAAKSIKNIQTSVGADDGSDLDDEDAWDSLQEAADKSVELGAQRHRLVVEAMLLCVHPPHVDQLRPMLERGDTIAVEQLAAWLTKQTIGRVVDEVEVGAKVDPTSPPPPSPSPSSTTGGEDSESKESTSTD